MYCIISVGPNSLWPWPIYSLGPKAQAEKGYSPESVTQVQNSLGTQPRRCSPRHVRDLTGRNGKNGIETTWEKI